MLVKGTPARLLTKGHTVVSSENTKSNIVDMLVGIVRSLPRQLCWLWILGEIDILNFTLLHQPSRESVI